MNITQLDWEQILDIMLFYKRSEGYIDEVDGKLLFFDSDPCINEVHACKVTIEEVKKYVNDFRDT